MLFLGASPVLGAEGVAKIEKVVFRGNRMIDSDALRGAMRLRQPVSWNPFRKTPYLGPDYLNLDLYRVLDLCRDRGFPLAVVRDVEVRYIEGGRRVRVEIEIGEGPRCSIEEVRLEGTQPLLRQRALDRIGVRAGQVLSRTRIDGSRDALAAFYGEAGYFGSRAFVDVILRGEAATVVYRVHEGPLYRMRDVVIDTTAGRLVRSAPSVIRREVLLESGDIFRTSKIVKTEERIFDTGVFRTVRVQPVADSLGLPQADLHVSVYERAPGWYGFGAGYSSDDRVRFLAEWGNRNIGGHARRLEANGDIAFSLGPSVRTRGLQLKSTLVRAVYTEPWILHKRARSQTSLYHAYERQTSFDQDITGLEEAVQHGIGRFSSIGIGITNKWVRTGDPSASGRRYVTRNLSASLDEDRRDNPLDPRRGSYALLLGEYAGGLLGGRTQFSRWSVTNSWYLRPLASSVLALRARAGWIVPVGRGTAREQDTLLVMRVPFEERFRLGGGTTVRGYRENSLGREGEKGEVIGGTALLLGNIELRFPILSIFSGALFLDAGNVWADPKEIKAERIRSGLRSGRYDPLNVAFGAGGGIRVWTPVGPFRVDYGFKLGRARPPGEKPGELHLSLGQAF